MNDRIIREGSFLIFDFIRPVWYVHASVSWARVTNQLRLTEWFHGLPQRLASSSSSLICTNYPPSASFSDACSPIDSVWLQPCLPHLKSNARLDEYPKSQSRKQNPTSIHPMRVGQPSTSTP